MDYSSDEEELGLQRKALQVELPEDFDPTKIPQNGEEYLQRVMYEAKECQKIVVVPLDEKKRKTISYKLDLREDCIKAPKVMIPTLEWQEEKVADFKRFTKYVARKVSQEPTNNDIQPNLWKNIVNTSTPKFSDVIRLTQTSKIKLLQIILDEMEFIKDGETLSYELSVWIYSLLATLEVPLCPNSCHYLRELARKCSSIRSKLPPNCPISSFKSLNLIICIVARYFRQLDLADVPNDV